MSCQPDCPDGRSSCCGVGISWPAEALQPPRTLHDFSFSVLGSNIVFPHPDFWCPCRPWWRRRRGGWAPSLILSYTSANPGHSSDFSHKLTSPQLCLGNWTVITSKNESRSSSYFRKFSSQFSSLRASQLAKTFFLVSKYLVFLIIFKHFFCSFETESVIESLCRWYSWYIWRSWYRMNMRVSSKKMSGTWVIVAWWNDWRVSEV